MKVRDTKQSALTRNLSPEGRAVGGEVRSKQGYGWRCTERHCFLQGTEEASDRVGKINNRIQITTERIPWLSEGGKEGQGTVFSNEVKSAYS